MRTVTIKYQKVTQLIQGMWSRPKLAVLLFVLSSLVRGSQSRIFGLRGILPVCSCSWCGTSHSSFKTGACWPKQFYRVVQKKRGHSTFSQISRKLLKISKWFFAHIKASVCRTWNIHTNFSNSFYSLAPSGEYWTIASISAKASWCRSGSRAWAKRALCSWNRELRSTVSIRPTARRSLVKVCCQTSVQDAAVTSGRYSKTGRHRILLEALCNISSMKTSTSSSRTCGPQTARIWIRWTMDCCLGSASGHGLPPQNVHACTRTKTCHCHSLAATVTSVSWPKYRRIAASPWKRGTV